MLVHTLNYDYQIVCKRKFLNNWDPSNVLKLKISLHQQHASIITNLRNMHCELHYKSCIHTHSLIFFISNQTFHSYKINLKLNKKETCHDLWTGNCQSGILWGKRLKNIKPDPWTQQPKFRALFSLQLWHIKRFCTALSGEKIR